MKNFSKLVMALVAVAVMIACTHDAKHDEHAKHEEVHAAATNELVLNNGAKWQANPETTAGVLNMIQFMNEFVGKENPEAYKELSVMLLNEFELIFKQCTMKGDAHTQLHNFLLPMKESFEIFNSGELEQQQAEFAKLTAHLAKYEQFFE